MDHFFSVVEIQVNNGIPAAPAVELVIPVDQELESVKAAEKAAQGIKYTKLGYAYQNPRDYTAVYVLNEDGGIWHFEIMDNRQDKTGEIYSLVEIQKNGETMAAVPVNIQIGENALSVIMQAYHNSLSYAWNVKRDYTLAVVLDKENEIPYCAESVDYTSAE